MSDKTLTWKPIEDEAGTGPLTGKVSDIADILLNQKENLKDNIGLIGGQTGVAIFLFNYAKFRQEEKYYDRGMEILSNVFDAINDGFSYHTFSSGLAGVGWTVEHLVRNDFLEADTDEILKELDPFIHQAMILEIKENNNYDFLHGAVGCGIYFLERLANPKAREYLSELVDELKNRSQQEENGSIKWRSILNREDNSEGYNLSLSHGIASIIAFLAYLHRLDICREKVNPLLEGAVRYMLSHSLDISQFESHFPSWVQEGQPLSHSRLAWCYGDLGIGISLWQAARIMGNKELEQRAVEVLKHSAGRKDLKENAVIDAGLCHGAAGIAHIYNRMFHYTGIEIFKDSARYWLEQTVKMARHEDGFAGYKAWHTEKYGGWVAEPGILEGIAGIGLAILAAISDIEPIWDRCLLCS